MIDRPMTAGRRMVQAALAIRAARQPEKQDEPSQPVPYWSERQERAHLAKHDPWRDGR